MIPIVARRGARHPGRVVRPHGMLSARLVVVAAVIAAVVTVVRQVREDAAALRSASDFASGEQPLVLIAGPRIPRPASSAN